MAVEPLGSLPQSDPPPGPLHPAGTRSAAPMTVMPTQSPAEALRDSWLTSQTKVRHQGLRPSFVFFAPFNRHFDPEDGPPASSLSGFRLARKLDIKL
eukprot:767019-Hanusia_phi.AAC.2